MCLGLLMAIFELETHSENRFDSLMKIARFMQDSKKNRDFLITKCFVLVLLASSTMSIGGIKFLEQVVTALDLVINKMEDRKGMKKMILKRQIECEWVHPMGMCRDSILLWERPEKKSNLCLRPKIHCGMRQSIGANDASRLLGQPLCT
ncbi:U-box domain-containing protein 27 [Spatholobus suberectus]|nr:U-box domain-containing protein 27 [Spatholobus suberectus]